ncbi:MAG TPA: PAS domain S-box protein [Casimicrobiaceae bacterium]|nr:PAS domain S-box protein [Casimicrobiaceae bacterium]
MSVAALVLLTLVFGLVAWLANARAPETVRAMLIVAVPVIAVVAFLLYRDSHSRESMRRALQSMQARASGFFESAMDPIISIDEGQRIVLFNAAAEAAFRWPRQAVLGQPIEMLIPERFHTAHRAYVAQFAKTGVTSRRMGGLNALTGLRANGEQFPIEASISQHVENGHKILTVVLRDVSARVRSESLLTRSEARLRGILDSAMDGIITVDDQQKILLFNAAAERMFDCPQDQAIGGSLSWFIPDRYRGAHARHIEAFGATGVTSRRMGGTRVVTGLRRNGGEFPIDASISQLAEGNSKFYTVILRDVTERVQALESLSRSREELRELASAAISAREQEQRRIARELHDELAQSMSALKMDITLIRAGAADLDGALAKRLDRMEAQIDTTIAAIRRIAADLRPLLLDDLGLAAALKSLVKEFGRHNSIACELMLPGEDLELPVAHASAVFRIVQESLTNVGKHAKASHVDVAVATERDNVNVTVHDDGVGFATDAPRKAESYGLLGVRERAYLLGGEARVTSAPGRGTRLEVRIPLATVTTTSA